MARRCRPAAAAESCGPTAAAQEAATPQPRGPPRLPALPSHAVTSAAHRLSSEGWGPFDTVIGPDDGLPAVHGEGASEDSASVIPEVVLPTAVAVAPTAPGGIAALLLGGGGVGAGGLLSCGLGSVGRFLQLRAQMSHLDTIIEDVDAVAVVPRPPTAMLEATAHADHQPVPPSIADPEPENTAAAGTPEPALFADTTTTNDVAADADAAEPVSSTSSHSDAPQPAAVP